MAQMMSFMIEDSDFSKFDHGYSVKLFFEVGDFLLFTIDLCCLVLSCCQDLKVVDLYY